jgi:intein/homing endonuclease
MENYKHCFAKQRIFDLGNKLFISGNQILTPRYKPELNLYEIRKLNTHITSNSELIEKGEIKTIKDYNDLVRMGFMIISEKATDRHFMSQHVSYLIKRYNAHIPSLKGVPASHTLEYDELNDRIRLKGRNAGPLNYGPWIFVSPQKREKQIEYLNMVDNTQKIKRKLLSRYMHIEEVPDIISIPEIPIMISTQGEVVCLENGRDEPCIGLVGGRGCSLGVVKIWIKNLKGFKLESIEDLYNKKIYPQAITLNEKTLKIEIMPIAKVIKRDPLPIINIKVRGHETIKVTPGHKMLVMDEMGELIRKAAEEIKVGDILPICCKIPLVGNLHEYKGKYIINRSNQYITYNPEIHNYTLKLDRDLGYLVGFWLANGCFGRTKIMFSEKNVEVREKIFNIIKTKGLGYIYKKDEKDFTLSNLALRDFLKQFGNLAGGKFLPDFIFYSNSNLKKGLIAGYFNSDGTLIVSKEKKRKLECSFTTKSKKLRDGLVFLLKQFGIIFSISIRKGPIGKYRNNLYYRASMDPTFVEKFIQEFELVRENKKNAAEIFLELISAGRNLQSHYNKIPMTKFIKKRYKIKWDKRLNLIGREAFIRMKIPGLVRFYNSDISYVPVIGIKREENTLPVYDIKVAGNNNILLENQVFIAQSGKTLHAHSIIDHAYWKKPNMRIAVLNDSLFQTLPWTLPCDRTESNEEIVIFSNAIKKIGEHPLPMPLVYLHPNTDTLRDDNMVFPTEEISFKMSIPFEHVIQNYSYFMRGKKEWLLGKSAPYFRNIKDDISKCKTLEEIEEALNLAVEEEKLNKQSKDKIFSVLVDMYNQRILDVNTGIPARWEVEKKGEKRTSENPILAVMSAGLVPVVMTQNLLPKDYFPQYMRYFIDSIFDYQVEEGKYKGEATWMFIDELPDLSSTENRTPAAESLRRCVTEGRNPKLGTIFALQNWTKVDPLIRNNTTHLLSYHNKSQEANEIAKDFDLPNHIRQDIINLQKFRCVAMTHEEFVVYTCEGERYKTSDPIKGIAVMPLSQHQAPGGTKTSKGDDDEEDES